MDPPPLEMWPCHSRHTKQRWQGTQGFVNTHVHRLCIREEIWGSRERAAGRWRRGGGSSTECFCARPALLVITVCRWGVMLTLLRQASLLLWVATLWLVSPSPLPARAEFNPGLPFPVSPAGIISSQAHRPSSAGESMGSGTVSATMSNTDWAFGGVGIHLCRGVCGACGDVRLRRREYCVFTAPLPLGLCCTVFCLRSGLSHAENTQTLRWLWSGWKIERRRRSRGRVYPHVGSQSNWEFLNIV